MSEKTKVRSKLGNRNHDDFPFRPFKFDLQVRGQEVEIDGKLVYVEKELQESVFRILNSRHQLIAVAFPNLMYNEGRHHPEMRFFIHLIGQRVTGFEQFTIDELQSLINTTRDYDIRKKFQGLGKDDLKMKLKCKIFNQTYEKGGPCPMNRSDLAKGLCETLSELYNPNKLMANREGGATLGEAAGVSADALKDRLNPAAAEEDQSVETRPES